MQAGTYTYICQGCRGSKVSKVTDGCSAESIVIKCPDCGGTGLLEIEGDGLSGCTEEESSDPVQLQ